jgi:hypothetical protein
MFIRSASSLDFGLNFGPGLRDSRLGKVAYNVSDGQANPHPSSWPGPFCPVKMVAGPESSLINAEVNPKFQEHQSLPQLGSTHNVASHAGYVAIARDAA